MNGETAEQINTRAALKVAVRALDSIVADAERSESHERGGCHHGYCATCLADDARREVAKLMGV